VPGDAAPPSTAKKSARAPARRELPALPGTVQSMACRYPASPGSGSCERKAAAGCIAKLCVGSFLAPLGISSYCFSSPRLLLQSLCQGQLHLLSSTPRLHRPRRGGTSHREGRRTGAASGSLLIFPPHGVSTTGSEDTQHSQYLLQGRTALSLLCKGQ